MTRSIELSQETAIGESHVYGVFFVELLFTVPLRLSTLPYTFAWNGYSWTGAGSLGTLSSVDENSDLQARGIDMTLSGLDSSLIASALAEHYQGKGCSVWFCPLNDDGQLIGTPKRIFKGRIDTMSIEAGEKAAITLTAESKLIDFFRPRTSRFNDADQQAKYPGDKGLEYAEQMVDKEIAWGTS